MKFSITKQVFHFRQPAGTSRGVYTERTSWMVTVTDERWPGRVGRGECAPLPDLSCDAIPDYENVLRRLCDVMQQKGTLDVQMLRPYPSMLFGLETALRNLQHGGDVVYDTPFTQGRVGIPINGLVWMGSYDEMLSRIDEKVKSGFHCIKLKIGAIDFNRELELIRHIRNVFSSEVIQLRVDANGAFAPHQALRKLEQLSLFDIHSIEQPIRQGNWKSMAELCRISPLPIALDEELIGVNIPQMKEQLLDVIRPSYIILKPSLHGGISGVEEWVRMADQRGIQHWITSALESNVGLSAIAQFCAHVYGEHIQMPQGLGTGQLFTDNIQIPLEIRGEKLYFGHGSERH